LFVTFNESENRWELKGSPEDTLLATATTINGAWTIIVEEPGLQSITFQCGDTTPEEN
jgi:hypothetical protein